MRPDYFAYFGSVAGDPLKGYYSFNLGAWHIISLNSNCSKIGQLQPRLTRGDLAPTGSGIAPGRLHACVHALPAIQHRGPIPEPDSAVASAI